MWLEGFGGFLFDDAPERGWGDDMCWCVLNCSMRGRGRLARGAGGRQKSYRSLALGGDIFWNVVSYRAVPVFVPFNLARIGRN